MWWCQVCSVYNAIKVTPKSSPSKNLLELQRQRELTNMNVFVSIALFGAMLSELCRVQTATCTDDEVQSWANTSGTCDGACVAMFCDCCTQSLTEGSSNSNYACCNAYSGLLQCAPNTPGVVSCATLPGESNGDSGASTATVFGVVSATMILASSAVNQLIL